MMPVRLNVIKVEINQSYQKSPFLIMLASAGMTGEGERILKLT